MSLLSSLLSHYGKNTLPSITKFLLLVFAIAIVYLLLRKYGSTPKKAGWRYCLSFIRHLRFSSFARFLGRLILILLVAAILFVSIDRITGYFFKKQLDGVAERISETWEEIGELNVYEGRIKDIGYYTRKNSLTGLLSVAFMAPYTYETVYSVNLKECEPILFEQETSTVKVFLPPPRMSKSTLAVEAKDVDVQFNLGGHYSAEMLDEFRKNRKTALDAIYVENQYNLFAAWRSAEENIKGLIAPILAQFAPEWNLEITMQEPAEPPAPAYGPMPSAEFAPASP